ncbi:hypothetical protein P67b_00095 [Ruegeria phage Tedan]|nr:hypothetical protein P67b_00095 [Ruegeria phage Tedan]
MRLERDRFSIDVLAARGKPLPEWYLDEPPIATADAFYLNAFGKLNTERNMQGHIPWSSIMQYGRHVGLDHDMLDTLEIIIRKMDEPYRKWQEAEAEKRAKASQKDSMPKSGRSTMAKG